MREPLRPASRCRVAPRPRLPDAVGGSIVPAACEEVSIGDGAMNFGAGFVTGSQYICPTNVSNANWSVPSRAFEELFEEPHLIALHCGRRAGAVRYNAVGCRGCCWFGRKVLSLVGDCHVRAAPRVTLRCDVLNRLAFHTSQAGRLPAAPHVRGGPNRYVAPGHPHRRGQRLGLRPAYRVLRPQRHRGRTRCLPPALQLDTSRSSRRGSRHSHAPDILLPSAAAADHGCAAGDTPLYAHFIHYAGEASWTATSDDGEELCAEEYPSTGFLGMDGLDHHDTGCCLPSDTGLVAGTILATRAEMAV